MLPTLFEQALVAYLLSQIPGTAIIGGHSNEDQPSGPRIIVTATSGGGDLIQNAGVDALTIEIQCLAPAGTPTLDPDPIMTVNLFAAAVIGALQLSQLDAVKAAIKRNPSLGFSGLEYNGHREGRDAERALHGVLLNYTAWSALLG